MLRPDDVAFRRSANVALGDFSTGWLDYSFSSRGEEKLLTKPEKYCRVMIYGTLETRTETPILPKPSFS